MVADMMMLRNGWVLLLLCAMPAFVSAQVLTDPTRPPAEISAPSVLSGPVVVSESNKLQSVIISPTRRAAIINGQMIELGAEYGGAKLIEVSESGAVLQGAQGRQVLTLFPGVKISKKGLAPQKTQVASAVAVKMKKAAKKKKRSRKPAGQAVQPKKNEGGGE